MNNLEEYAEKAREIGLHYYKGSQAEDILLLSWWMHLVETKDIEKVTTPDSRRLPDFLQIFQHPTFLFYTLSTNGNIDFTMWFKEAPPTGFGTAFASGWTHPSLRGKRRHAILSSFCYSLALKTWPNLLGFTWQPSILDLHRKMGYDIVGNIPKFMGQEMVYIVNLTKENFEKSKLFNIGEKLWADQ
jgi:hypothetical protein